MKKVAIVADNYKLPTFRKELTKAGFTFEEKAFTDATTSIFITTDKVDRLHSICAKVQSSFFHQN